VKGKDWFILRSPEQVGFVFACAAKPYDPSEMKQRLCVCLEYDRPCDLFDILCSASDNAEVSVLIYGRNDRWILSSCVLFDILCLLRLEIFL